MFGSKNKQIDELLTQVAELHDELQQAYHMMEQARTTSVSALNAKLNAMRQVTFDE